MGTTRSLTIVKSRWTEESNEWKTNAVIYSHWDGYLEGQGRLLYDLLKDPHVVNGKSDANPRPYVNGLGRLASTIIFEMEDEGHEPELLDSYKIVGQEFEYHILVEYGFNGGAVSLKVYDGPMTFFGNGGDKCDNLIFDGTVEEFGVFLDNQKDEQIDALQIDALEEE